MPILDIIRSPRPTKPQLGIGLDYQRPMLDGLVAFLAMQEGGGQITNALPYGIPGTFQGTTPPIWTPNHDDGSACLKFNGTTGIVDSYLDFGSDPRFLDLAKAKAMSVAFRLGYSGNTQRGWIQKSGGSSTTGKGWGVGAQNNVVFLVMFSGASNFQVSTSGTPYHGTALQTVVCTYDGLNTSTSGHIYVDGIDRATASSPGAGAQNSDTGLALQIGKMDQGSGAAGNNFNGEMSWVALWNRALTQPEAAEMALFPNILFEFTTRRIGLLGGLPANIQPFTWLIS